jgi:hypothetical protein
MNIPKDLPTWATDQNYTNGPDVGTPTKIVPSSGELAEGNIRGTAPSPQKFNYWQNNVSAWIESLAPLAANNWFPVFEMATTGETTAAAGEEFWAFSGRSGGGSEQSVAASGRGSAIAFIDRAGGTTDEGNLWVSSGLGSIPVHSSADMILRKISPGFTDISEACFGLDNGSERLLIIRQGAGGVYSYTMTDLFADSPSETLKATLGAAYTRLHYSPLFGRWYASKFGAAQSCLDTDLSDWDAITIPATHSWTSQSIYRFVNGASEQTDAGQVWLAWAGGSGDQFLFTEDGTTLIDAEIDSGLSGYQIKGVAYSKSRDCFGALLHDGTSAKFYVSNSSNPSDGWTLRSTWTMGSNGIAYDVCAIGPCWVVSQQRRFRISYDGGDSWKNLSVPWTQTAVCPSDIADIDGRGFKRLIPSNGRILAVMAGVPVHVRSSEAADEDVSQHMRILSSLRIGPVENEY